MYMFKRLILLALAMTVTACANMQQLMKENIKEPEVIYKNISVGQLTSDKVELKPTFSITNKNSYTIPVDGLKYELLFNNNTMIKGETDKIGDLPANQSKDVTLGIDLTKETLASVQDILLTESQIDYVIKGEVGVMGFRFPFKKASTLYKPSISLGKLEIKKSSFRQIDMLLTLTVNNKNDFDLPLDMLAYKVSSGLNQLVSGDLKNQKIEQGINHIKIPLSVNLSQLFSSVFSLMQNPQLPLTFEFSAGGFEKSVEQTLNLRSLL